MHDQSGNGILEEFRLEFLDCWQRLPNKGFFLTLLLVWLALFQFLGNSTLGYISTKSLFYWLYNAFTAGGRTDAFEEETIGLLVPAAVLIIFWLRRREFMALEIKLWWPGLLLMALGALFHAVGYLVQQPRISVVGLFVGLYGITGMAWGWAWLRASYFPFLLFVFCVPLGSQAEVITFPLRLLVSRLVELVCHYVLFIDVVRQGTGLFNSTEHYNYEVAAACSGIRSLMATLAIAVTLAFYSFGKWWKRLVVIGSAFPLAVAGNLLRMLTIVVAAEIGGQKSGNYVHESGFFSLLPYVPVFFGLFWLERRLHEEPEPGVGTMMEAKPA